MDSEKELLTQDLSKQEKPEEIEKFIEDATLLGHEDIAELGRKKLQEISEKASAIEKTGESQISQVDTMGGNQAEVSERTKEVDQKIEDVKAEAVRQIEEVKVQPTEEKGEVKSENNGGSKELEEKIVLPENQQKSEEEKRIDRLIFDKKEEIVMLKERLNTTSFRLEKNDKSKVSLNEYLNKLVKKSSLSSEVGGNNWELVEESQKLRQLELQEKARMDQLKQSGKTWGESRADSEIKELNKQMDSLTKEDISQKYGYSNPGEGIIYLKGPSGEIGKDGVMTLKEALESSVLYHKDLVNEYNNKIVENEQEIKNLEIKKKEENNESQEDKELKQKAESVEKEFDNIKEKVTDKWKKFEESGELEKSIQYLDAKEAIENLSKYQLSQDSGSGSWRVVTTKIGDFDNLVQQKAFEFGKEISDFYQKLIHGEMNHDDSKDATKRIFDIQNKAQYFRLDINIKPHNELMALYKQRVSSLK